MKRSTVVAVLLAAVVGFGAGAYLGVHRAVAVMRPMQQGHALADLNFTLEELVWHRSGEAGRALSFGEQRLEWAILDLSQGREESALPLDVRQALSAAKIYRTVFPFENASGQVRDLLDRLPAEGLDPKSCSPAVRYLLSRTTSG